MTGENRVPEEEMEGENASSRAEPGSEGDLEIEEEQASQVKGGWIYQPKDRL